jgi:hypothetical protein
MCARSEVAPQCLCTHVCIHAIACMYVCMHVCMYVCVYVCMYACMHVCVQLYILWAGAENKLNTIGLQLVNTETIRSTSPQWKVCVRVCECIFTYIRSSTQCPPPPPPFSLSPTASHIQGHTSRGAAYTICAYIYINTPPHTHTHNSSHSLSAELS